MGSMASRPFLSASPGGIQNRSHVPSLSPQESRSPRVPAEKGRIFPRFSNLGGAPHNSCHLGPGFWPSAAGRAGDRRVREVQARGALCHHCTILQYFAPKLATRDLADREPQDAVAVSWGPNLSGRCRYITYSQACLSSLCASPRPRQTRASQALIRQELGEPNNSAAFLM